MNRVQQAFQDERQRGKIIGAAAVVVELFLLFWLFPRQAWLNGNYAACAKAHWSPTLEQYICDVEATKSLWDYTPTFLSTDWNMTHLTALLALVVLNVVVIGAYELYTTFGREASYTIGRMLSGRKMRKRSPRNKQPNKLNV